MDYVNQISEFLNSQKATELKLTHLIVITEEYDMEEDEWYPVTANHVYLNEGGILCVRDTDCDEEDGSYETEWEVASLNENQQSEILWALQNGNYEHIPTYYQPTVKDEDGNEYFPSCLYSFEVFRTKEDAIKFLKRYEYDEKDIIVTEYKGDAIEDHTFVDVN